MKISDEVLIDEWVQDRIDYLEEWEGNEMKLLRKAVEFGYSLGKQGLEKAEAQIGNLQAQLSEMANEIDDTLKRAADRF